jgi:hypothetical protein
LWPVGLWPACSPLIVVGCWPGLWVSSFCMFVAWLVDGLGLGMHLFVNIGCWHAPLQQHLGEGVTARHQTQPSDRQWVSDSRAHRTWQCKHTQPLRAACIGCASMYLPTHVCLFVRVCLPVWFLVFVAVAFFNLCGVCVCVNQHRPGHTLNTLYMHTNPSHTIRAENQTNRATVRSTVHQKHTRTNFEDEH